jgi:hypothetical protein
MTVSDFAVGAETIFKPPTNEVATRTPGGCNLGVASTATQVARPARPAGFLRVNVGAGNECLARRLV